MKLRIFTFNFTNSQFLGQESIFDKNYRHIFLLSKINYNSKLMLGHKAHGSIMKKK